VSASCESVLEGVRCLRDDGHRGPHIGGGDDGRGFTWSSAELEYKMRDPGVEAAVRDVIVELLAAVDHHAPLNSPHEGWAVIREELDELWEHVRADTGRSPEARVEARQVAAMAIRYMVNIARGETR
jgi:hypothetical protein